MMKQQLLLLTFMITILATILLFIGAWNIACILLIGDLIMVMVNIIDANRLLKTEEEEV